MSIGWALLGTGRHALKNVLPQMKKAAGTRLAAVVSLGMCVLFTFSGMFAWNQLWFFFAANYLKIGTDDYYWPAPTGWPPPT